MNSLETWREWFEASLPQSVVGIGLTAFSRIVPSLLLQRYRIVCLRTSRDIALLSEDVDIWSLEEELGMPVPLTSSGDLLQHAAVREYLSRIGRPVALLPYRSTRAAESVAQEEKWSILSTPIDVRKAPETKANFPSLLARAGIAAPASETVGLGVLTLARIAALKRQLGEKLVLQAADRAGGGGVTTAFITDEADIPDALQRLGQMARGSTEDFRVKVTAYVEGESASVLGCVTPIGTVAGPVATQIIDRPELVSPLRGRGAFCGHDWNRAGEYTGTVRATAQQMAVAVGEVLREDGFLGVFGLDLLVDTPRDAVVPIECNARFTGAFPMVSLLQAGAGIAPLDALHIASFAGIPLPDLERSSVELAQPVRGGHLVLSNVLPKAATVTGDLPGGVYRLRAGQLEFVRPGWSYVHIAHPGEFVLTGGLPIVGTRLAAADELSRIGHLLTREPLIDGQGHVLEWAQTAVKAVQTTLRLRCDATVSP